MAKRGPAELPYDLPVSLKRAKAEYEPRLSAEAVCRERPEEVPVSIQVAAALKSDDRARWMTRALKSMASGSSRPSDLFDVISHSRFSAGVSGGLAQKMLEELHRYLEHFPEKLRQVLLSGNFPLAEAAAAARAGKTTVVDGEAAETADGIMARCVDFVRQNESAIQAVHDLEARTFQVELKRLSQQQVWGITWARPAFEARRRVVQGIVPETPAHRWNVEQEQTGDGRSIHEGDELIAMNGQRSWEAMATIRDLLEARLTFVESCGSDAAPAGPSERSAEGIATDRQQEDADSPPAFRLGDYTLDASGSGWWGHASGQWLFSKSEGVYFQTATGNLFLEDPV
ncbi:unnamed protein product, partial [Polarella glacialis]